MSASASGERTVFVVGVVVVVILTASNRPDRVSEVALFGIYTYMPHCRWMRMHTYSINIYYV